MTVELPARPRRDLRPDRNRRARHVRPAGPAGRDPQAADPAAPDRGGRRAGRRCSPSRARPPINLRTRMTSDREYVVLARGLDAKLSDRIRELSAGDQPALAGLLLEPEQERLYPQPGGGPKTSLAAHLLGFVNREGDRPVRRRAVLPGPARRHAADRRGAARCRGQRGARLVVGDPAGGARRGPAPDDRRGAPGRGRAGAPRHVDRRPREAGVRRRHGPVQRRDLRLRQLPVVRRERLPGGRRDRARPVRRPARVHRLRAGLRVQDDDRDRGPGRRDRDAVDAVQGRRHAPPRRRQGEDRQREPQGHGHR